MRRGRPEPARPAARRTATWTSGPTRLDDAVAPVSAAPRPSGGPLSVGRGRQRRRRLPRAAGGRVRGSTWSPTRPRPTTRSHGYVPAGIDAGGGGSACGPTDPAELRARGPGSRWPAHCEAMVGFLRAGAEVFDYGNNLRGEARAGGFADAFAYPGFVPAYIRPLFCEGKGPFRWVALSGDPADIAATDAAVLEAVPRRRAACSAGWSWRRAGPLPGAAGPHLLARATASATGPALAFNDLVRAGRRAGARSSSAATTSTPARWPRPTGRPRPWPTAPTPSPTGPSSTPCSTWPRGRPGWPSTTAAGVGMGKSIHAGAAAGGRRHRRRRPAGRADAVQRPRHRRHAPRRRRLRRGARRWPASGGWTCPGSPAPGPRERAGPAGPADFLLTGAGQLVTCDPGLGEGPLGLVERGAVAAAGGRVVYAGPEAGLSGLEVAAGRPGWTPAAGRCSRGFVDAHTHLVFAGDRADEFAARLRGVGYEEALAAGGGIKRTVRETRAAADAELVATAARRLATALAHGTTTLEAKSGYGLTVEDERRLPGGAGPAGRAVPGRAGPDLPRRPPDPRGVRRRPRRLPGPAGARDAAGVRAPGRVRATRSATWGR